ncbi:MAG TPA: hypothetical protein V6D08_18495 [Candidatus Obscuribacterales bacterium]
MIKIEAGKVDLKRPETGPGELVDTALESLRGRAERELALRQPTRRVAGPAKIFIDRTVGK